ncbi:MAG: hypothetical protein BWY79_02153 [Actinobacteria bacterium ADurb.Bin444]|nr:MAG: hypothetical protein BWY79_02153 [Actinobacteria bacterium ADurb.Bin444]
MVVPRPGEREAILEYLSRSGVTADQILDFEVSDEGLVVAVD